jgi:hypothetical protein
MHPNKAGNDDRRRTDKRGAGIEMKAKAKRALQSAVGGLKAGQLEWQRGS